MKVGSVGVLRDRTEGERRVALVPDGARRLIRTGLAVMVESGAGAGAHLADSAYADAGAEMATREEVLDKADVLFCVSRPPADELRRLRAGQAVIGLLAPQEDAGLFEELGARGVVAVSMERLPRTVSRAQSMDVLTSQASVAGYRAVLVAATAYDRFFPLLITAAGTARPAKVLVLGTGVAGLQAIGTARRLGAIVSAYDVRPEARTEAESVGATFIELTSVGPASGDGGYARALTDDERLAQQQELAGHIARHDVIITTAQVPGRRPPVLVTDDTLKAMAAGSVIVDMGASPLGGNVTGSVPGQTVVTENGVTVIGASGLPSSMAAAASDMYSRNISALLQYLVSDGQLVLNRDDELTAGVLITADGVVVHPALTPNTREEGPAANAVPGSAN